MGNYIKFGVFALFLAIAYGTAWFKAYHLSEQYYQYASQQLQAGNATLALKGMNKLELRQGDQYFGGFQQVIETWERTLIGPKPSFYQKSLAMPEEIISQLDIKQLEMFIQTYVELDSRYVPKVADQLIKVARQQGNCELSNEMSEFLVEAFPYYQAKQHSCVEDVVFHDSVAR